MTSFSVLEICAGAGGQALGLEKSGFSCAAALEIDCHACQTLSHNRPNWNVIETDVKEFDAREFKGIDLLAGGVPCPPFSIAGKQLGADDERDLFPSALRLIGECSPNAVMLENVRGLASPRFDSYRTDVMQKLSKMGYVPSWAVINSSDYGVPQLRPRFLLVAVKSRFSDAFQFPKPISRPVTVADVLFDLVSGDGWLGAEEWLKKADKIAPTIVGGSKKHGGADLGPTRAKRQWLEFGVDGKGIANSNPDISTPVDALIRLTLRMVARIQGFPDGWEFMGGKTAQYRQIGNAFPPPVATCMGVAIRHALQGLPRNYDQGDQMNLGFAA